MKRVPLVVLLGTALLAASPAEACRPFGSYVFVEDDEGGIWFTEGDNNAISRLMPDGDVRSFPLPTPHAEPSSIALGKKGEVWFVESDAMQIGRLGPDERITEYPTTDGHPVLVAVDSKGEVWFTQMAGDHPAATGEHTGHEKKWISKIGRITADERTLDYPLAAGWPTSIAIDPRDVVWVTILVRGDLVGGNGRPLGKLAKVDREGRWTILQEWENSCPSNLTLTPDGGLAFSDHCRGTFARIDARMKLSETAFPPKTTIQQMSATRDGTLWFTAAEGGRIGRIATDNRVEFVDRPPNGDEPFAILATKSGDIVYSEFYNYNINRLTNEGVFEEFLVNVDQRSGVRIAKEGEVCAVKFGARIVEKKEMDLLRSEEVKNGRFRATADGVEKMVEERCLNCHDARRLLLSRRSDWTPSIERMQDYMRIRDVPQLTDEEKNILIGYFNTYYTIAAERRVER